MMTPILFAILGGVLVGISRSVNGRLSLSTSALTASFWNHIVGFAFLTAVALIFGGLMPNGWPDAPLTAWAGGTIGVLFVASGSWFVARIGVTTTAMLVIAGQMVSGVALDLALGRADGLWIKALGVALILGGMAMLRRR